MDDLTFDFKQMTRHNHDGGKTTQHDRFRMLALIADQLREGGFRRMRAQSLKPKHVHHLVGRWQSEELDAGTIKNRMAALRWWSRKIGKPDVIPNDNAALGIEKRQYIPTVNRAKTLEEDVLAKVTNEYVRLSLMLQQAFGLRREEAIKFQPEYADRGDHIDLMKSWCKGGRPRSIPIRNAEQREVLDEVHRLTKDGSLIPKEKMFWQQVNSFEWQCRKAGLSATHGLRHQYAQTRYEEITGWKAPKAGGPGIRELTPEQRIKDRMARQTISRELGHERLEVTNVYLGSRCMS